jgi:predicted O-methyltransferase YrrM
VVPGQAWTTDPFHLRHGRAYADRAMDDAAVDRLPLAWAALTADTNAIGFTMASETRTGALLAVLAAAKPGGRMLELGTGTGLSASWLLSGMDQAATLDTVDTDSTTVDVARRHLGRDARVTFHVTDAATFVQQAAPGTYDLIFADAWPGKFSHLDAALALLKPGGIYVIDDLLPQSNWPEGHGPKVSALMADISERSAFSSAVLAWASGLMIVVRR